MMFLRQYAGWGVEQGCIRPGLVLELAKIPRVPQQVLAPRGLTRPELRRYLKQVDLLAGTRDRALVYMLLYLGLRVGEAEHLRLEDVELSERKGLVRIRSEWAKGGKSRVVPIPATARKTLADYLDKRGREPGRLFLGERGPLGRHGLSSIVIKYGDAARLKLSPHTLRHSFAFRFLQVSGNDLVGLADLMGHSNVNTT